MSGHLFLVHGKIEELTHDAALIPVASSLGFNKIWKPLLGNWPSAPPTWSDGWGRIEGTEQWLVQVADGEYRRVLERLSKAVRDVASRDLQPLGGRGRTLGGAACPWHRSWWPPTRTGLGAEGCLSNTSRSWRSSTDLDFALVTPEASVFAAAQYLRRGTKMPPDEVDRVDRVARKLGQRARNDELALFIGAGASMPAGLPSWSELIKQLAVGVPGAESEAFRALGATDQAELIQETAGERSQATSGGHRPGRSPTGAHPRTPCRPGRPQHGDDQLRPVLRTGSQGLRSDHGERPSLGLGRRF